jgi:hypothetical protein
MKQKSLFDVWGKIRVVHLNRLLRPLNVRLVEKKSKAWGDKVVITAEAIPDVEVKPVVVPPADPVVPVGGP